MHQLFALTREHVLTPQYSLGLSTSRGPRDHGTAGPHPVHGTATGQPRDTTGQHFFPKNPPKRLTRAPNSTRSQPSPPGARAAVLSVPLAPRFLQHHGTPRDGTKCGRCVWGGYTMVPREPRAAPGWLDAGERRGAPPPSLAKCKIATVDLQTRTWRHQFCNHARRQRGNQPLEAISLPVAVSLAGLAGGPD